MPLKKHVFNKKSYNFAKNSSNLTFFSLQQLGETSLVTLQWPGFGFKITVKFVFGYKARLKVSVSVVFGILLQQLDE